MLLVWAALGLLGTSPEPAAAPLFPQGFGKKRIYLDPGHGFAWNTGNISVRCEREEDFTLRAAQDLAARLKNTGHFTVRLSRAPGNRRISYESRVAEADAWGAHAFLSLHSDTRGLALPVAVHQGLTCSQNSDDPGFAILFNDDAAEPLLSRRASLARALARWMKGVGFSPYDGRDYVGLYAQDPVEAGVFADRRGGRVYVLRKPRMPSAIIETHHALDPREVAQWDEPATQQAFALAVAQALVDALR